MTEYLCPFCNCWEDKQKFSKHMIDHMLNNDDVGFVKVPESYEDYRRRFQQIGLYAERES